MAGPSQPVREALPPQQADAERTRQAAPSGPSLAPAFPPPPAPVFRRATTGPLPPPVFSRGQNAYGAPADRQGSGGPQAGSGDPKPGSGGPDAGSGDPKGSSGGPEAGSGGPKRANELLARLEQIDGGKKAKGGVKNDAQAVKKAFGKTGQQPGERIAGFLSLDAKARKAYIKLPERERLRVDRLLHAIQSPPGDAATLAHASIEKLLSKKIFQPPKGRKGAIAPENPVLAQFDARLGKPLTAELAARGLDAGGVIQQIVAALAFPGWVFQGKGTATCVPASLETILAKTAPDEYVRVAGGLLWDGHVDLRGGRTLDLSTAELGMDDGDRGSVHQLMQGSLLRLGQRLGEAGEGDDPYGRGRYARPAVFGSGTYAPGGANQPSREAPPPTRESPPAGLTGQQASLLYEQVVGDPAVPFKVNDANRKDAWSMVKAAVELLGSASVGVATINAQGKTVFHEITVTSIGRENVEIADSGLGNTRMIPIKQLKADLTSVIVPATFVAGQSQRVDEEGEASRPWVGKMVGSLQAGKGRQQDDDDPTGPAFRRRF